MIGNHDTILKSLFILNPGCRLRTDSGDLSCSWTYLQLEYHSMFQTHGGMAGVSSEPQHCWGLERVPREFEGPTYILQNAQVFFIQANWTPCMLGRLTLNHNELQEEVSLGRNRKNNVKVCDGPNVSRNHLKLIRWLLLIYICYYRRRRCFPEKCFGWTCSIESVYINVLTIKTSQDWRC